MMQLILPTTLLLAVAWTACSTGAAIHSRTKPPVTLAARDTPFHDLTPSPAADYFTPDAHENDDDDGQLETPDQWDEIVIDDQMFHNSRLNTADQPKLFAMVNALRQQHGAPPLQFDDTLEQMATRHSQYQATTKHMTHEDPRGTLGERLKRQHVQWREVGENVGHGHRTEQDVVNAWFQSAGHRRNLLHPQFTHMAVANVGSYWTQDFARYPLTKPKPDAQGAYWEWEL